jgi:hypothetical protein
MREAVSGRHVPEGEILDSLQRVPDAVSTLTPYADFVAHIENEKNEPRLISFTDSDGFHHNNSAGWDEVVKRFATLPAIHNPEVRPSAL